MVSLKISRIANKFGKFYGEYKGKVELCTIENAGSINILSDGTVELISSESGLKELKNMIKRLENTE